MALKSEITFLNTLTVIRYIFYQSFYSAIKIPNFFTSRAQNIANLKRKNYFSFFFLIFLAHDTTVRIS